MNTTATLKAPFVPLEHTRERFPYPRPILPGWKSRAIRSFNPPANRLLRSLPNVSIVSIEGFLRRVTLIRGEYLCEQETTPEYVYFPETAVISHQRLLADGRSVEIALSGSEGSVGMPSVFGSGVSSSFAEVAQDGTALRMERVLLIKTIHLHPEVIPRFAAEIGRFVAEISCRSICHTYHEVGQRMATWILLVAHLSGKSAISVTHEQIARALGVYRPTVTSAASLMRANGLVGYSRGMVTIVDRLRLENAACCCYHELVTAK